MQCWMQGTHTYRPDRNFKIVSVLRTVFPNFRTLSHPSERAISTSDLVVSGNRTAAQRREEPTGEHHGRNQQGNPTSEVDWSNCVTSDQGPGFCRADADDAVHSIPVLIPVQAAHHNEMMSPAVTE
jgi:hypothetical protein